MRLAFVFMLMFGLTARSAASPQGQRVTLDLKQATFFQLFDEIHKQTGLRFVYNTDQLGRLDAIDVKAEDTKVEEVLTNILRDGNLTFVMEDEVVMLVPKRVATQSPMTVTIEGTVSDNNTGEPLVGCLVTIPELDLWTVSDADGRFRFASAPTGSYQIESTHIGYEKLVYSVTVTQAIRSLTLKMKQLSLELNTVTVTATADNTMNSSSRIDRQAMEHTQPKSLRDLMQLLPGVMTFNTDLNNASANLIALREINGSSHLSNRNGVGIWINGAQVNDRASMVSPMFRSITNGDGQLEGDGFDTRRISLENVESVEVIPGIASAEYGDNSSGVVIVNTIKGRTPWNITFMTDPKIKLASFSKGVGVGKTGSLNFSGSYTSSARYLRSPKQSYQRETFAVEYSNTFMHNATRHFFSISASGYMSDNKTEADPDMASQDDYDAMNDHNIGLALSGKLLFDKPWITNLKYSYRFNLTNILTKDVTRQSGNVFSTSALESGEFYTDLLATDYLRDFRNQSRSISHFAQISADVVMGRTDGVMNTVVVGADFRSDGNTGRGSYFIPHYLEDGPTDINAYGPRNFRSQPLDDIPFVNVASFFITDRLYIPIAGNRQSLTIEPGVRVDMILNKVLNNRTAVDPRLNVRYAMVQNGDGLVRNLSLRGGYGRMSRLPGSIDMYSFDSFTDREETYKWASLTDPNYKQAVFSTLVRKGEDEINHDLKIQYSNKYEVGIDFDIAGFSGKVTYFNEELLNGYEKESMWSLESFPYRVYKNADYSETRPVYMDDPRSDRPTDQVLSLDGVPLDYDVINMISKVNKRGNANHAKKWGIEGRLVFPRINPLQTTVMLTGRYLNESQLDRKGKEIMVSGINNLEGSAVVPFMASYLGANTYFQGYHGKEFVTNAQFITHIPSLRMVATIELQAVWTDKWRFVPVEGLYHLGENDERIYGDYSKGWDGTRLYRDPIYYYVYNPTSKQFDRKAFTHELYDDPEMGQYKNQFQYTSTDGRNFNERSYKPYFMANFQISKEIGRRATVSLLVKNFTDSRPRRYNVHEFKYNYMNSEIYFGGDIKFKF